jgi:hypothetical protein
MASMGSLLSSRLLPLAVVLGSTYIIPWAQRAYVLSGYSGKNFAQTDVSNCEIIHKDTLIGCEDIHLYNSDEGNPLIFAACAERIEDRFVFCVFEWG